MASTTTTTLADYLFTRLRQLGVASIHGVPGDYNLALLDYVEPQGLHWVGNCNELNAGYAADEYARIKGVGALITTYGVWELSAANAIAGSYAELASVVHIVGTPARQQQESRALIHHTLNDGEFGHFARMYEEITVAQANLTDPRTCAQQIDMVIEQCLMHHRPVYVAIPTDMVTAEVDARRLALPVEASASISSADENAALELMLGRMYQSKRPLILIDGESAPYGILEELNSLISVTQWPTWTSVFGKGCVNESLPNVRGIWKGSWAPSEDVQYFDSADLILCFGPHFSGTNTYGYTSVPRSSVGILAWSTSVQVYSDMIRNVPVKQLLRRLMERLQLSKLTRIAVQPAINATASNTLAQPSDGPIRQDLFYRVLNEHLRAGDIVLAETGTAGHGCRDFRLPPHCRLFKPSTWFSIGYMLPAAQGAALAQRELDQLGQWHRHDSQQCPRAILLIGDGSLQMTVQELSTIIKERLNVTVILINNDGYTIERCIHGWKQPYNDVASWRYLDAPKFFGAANEDASGYKGLTAQAKTWEELQQALKECNDSEESVMRFVEVLMDRDDALKTLIKGLQQQQQQQQ